MKIKSKDKQARTADERSGGESEARAFLSGQQKSMNVTGEGESEGLSLS